MKNLKNLIRKNKKNPHLYLIGLWIILAVPTIVWWKESILWVAMMSLYANIEASFAAMEASK